jgi:hypothetical protein
MGTKQKAKNFNVWDQREARSYNMQGTSVSQQETEWEPDAGDSRL